jgi:hypothetical protein
MNQSISKMAEAIWEGDDDVMMKINSFEETFGTVTPKLATYLSLQTGSWCCEPFNEWVIQRGGIRNPSNMSYKPGEAIRYMEHPYQFFPWTHHFSNDIPPVHINQDEEIRKMAEAIWEGDGNIMTRINKFEEIFGDVSPKLATYLSLQTGGWCWEPFNEWVEERGGIRNPLNLPHNPGETISYMVHPYESFPWSHYFSA